MKIMMQQAAGPPTVLPGTIASDTPTWAKAVDSHPAEHLEADITIFRFSSSDDASSSLLTLASSWEDRFRASLEVTNQVSS